MDWIRIFRRDTQFAIFLLISCAFSAQAQAASNIPPVFGNLNASVTMYEFYDYRCSYCKATEPAVEQIMAEDKDLKIVFMDFPKLGPLSATAAIATLASMRQGSDKYLQFHKMLLSKNVYLTDEDVLYRTASSAGLDVAKLKKDMLDPAITRQIQANIAAGKEAGVRVTPSFVIGGQFYPGAARYYDLKQRISDARSGQIAH